MYRPSQTPSLTLSSTRVAEEDAENRNTPPDPESRSPPRATSRRPTDRHEGGAASRTVGHPRAKLKPRGGGEGPARVPSPLFSRIIASPIPSSLPVSD